VSNPASAKLFCLGGKKMKHQQQNITAGVVWCGGQQP